MSGLSRGRLTSNKVFECSAKAGNERIIVELPGIDDPARAQDVVQKSAFLKFTIVDKSQALDKVVTRFDEIARAAGISVASNKVLGDSAKKVGVTSLLTQKTDSGKKDSTTKSAGKTAADSTAAKPVVPGGLFGSNVAPGQMAGQYLVPEAAYDAISRALALPAMKDAMPPGKTILWAVDSIVSGTQRFRAFYVLDSREIITGAVLTDVDDGQR